MLFVLSLPSELDCFVVGFVCVAVWYGLALRLCYSTEIALCEWRCVLFCFVGVCGVVALFVFDLVCFVSVLFPLVCAMVLFL